MRIIGLITFIFLYIEDSIQGPDRLKKIREQLKSAGFETKSTLEKTPEVDTLESESKKCYADRIVYRCKNGKFQPGDTFSSSLNYYKEDTNMIMVDDIHAFMICSSRVYYKESLNILNSKTRFSLLNAMLNHFDYDVYRLKDYRINNEKSYWATLCSHIESITKAFTRHNDRYRLLNRRDNTKVLTEEESDKIVDLEPLFKLSLKRDKEILKERISYAEKRQWIRDTFRFKYELHFPGCVFLLRLPSESEEYRSHCLPVKESEIPIYFWQFNDLYYFIATKIEQDTSVLRSDDLYKTGKLNVPCVILMSLAEEPLLIEVRNQILNHLKKIYEGNPVNWPYSCFPDNWLPRLKEIISDESYTNIKHYIERVRPHQGTETNE